MAKRGESGLSLVVGVRKPRGMTSHDVVNRVRRIFGEKRVGHAGTLDPLATGVLAVCIGSATRLSEHLTSHDKSYVVRIAFGCATDTDDAEGIVTDRAPVPAQVRDRAFAERYVASLVGRAKQLPPVYSAIKVDGRKACDEARKGTIIKVQPRDIEIYRAELLAVGEDVVELKGAEGPCAIDTVTWDIAFSVSKGTYIRSIARDAGEALGCYAHVGALERTVAGGLALEDCCTLEALEAVKERAALDPVRLLQKRFVFVRDERLRAVENGGSLSAREIELFSYDAGKAHREACACMSDLRESTAPLEDGELVSVIGRNRLLALYGYEERGRRLKPAKVFQGGVSRGCA